MNQETKDELFKRRKLVVLELAKATGSVTKTCIEFGVPRSSFYEWKKKYDSGGIAALERKKPIPNYHPKQLSKTAVEKILELRKEYQLGPQRIKWYLERYHGITTSCSTVSKTLVRN